MHFQHMAVGRRPLSQQHLHQLQLSFFLQQQQHPRGVQPRTRRQHQLQRTNPSPHPEGQDLLGFGMVELHGPDLGTTAAIEGVAEGLLQLFSIQRRDSFRKHLAGQGIIKTIEHQTGHPVQAGRQRRGQWRGTGRQFRDRRKPFEVGEAPGLLAAVGQTKLFKRGSTALLHWRQHTARHGQAAP